MLNFMVLILLRERGNYVLEVPPRIVQGKLVDSNPS